MGLVRATPWAGRPALGWSVRWTVLTAVLLACGPAGEGTPDSSASPAEPSAGGEVLRMNIYAAEPLATPDGTGVYNALVEEAVRRADGPPVSWALVAAERSLRNVSAGIDDGDGPRIREMDTLFDALVRVDEPILRYDFVVFTCRDDLVVDGFASLAPWDLGVVRGWKILERNLGGARSLTNVRTPQLLFGLLREGRVDAVVIERTMGLAAAEAVDVPCARAVDPPLVSREMYVFLHERHAALAERMAVALREMKADRTFDRIVGQAPLEAGSFPHARGDE